MILLGLAILEAFANNDKFKPEMLYMLAFILDFSMIVGVFNVFMS